MRPLQIILLEDNKADLQSIIDQISDNYRITAVNSVTKAKTIFAASQFDLAILDIKINGKLDGIEFAKHIQHSKYPIPFIFITAMQGRYVFEKAKFTKPFVYLLKPFNILELEYSIEIAFEKYADQFNALSSSKGILLNNYLLVKNQNIIRKILIDDLEYIEVEDNYCTLYTLDKKHIIKFSLSKIKKLFTHKNFEQIHRKFLVNFDKIELINLSENAVYLKSGKSITISERYKKNFSKLYDIFK